MKRWNPEKQRQQQLPTARTTRGGEPEGKGKADNKAGSHKMHENDIGRAWTKRDLGGSCSRLRSASL
jgi:hypothetical protein